MVSWIVSYILWNVWAYDVISISVVAPTPEPVEKRKTKRRRKEASEEKEVKEESVTGELVVVL